MTLARAFAGQEIALVVTVEMHLESLAIRFIALQKLGLDFRLTRGGDQGCAPVLGRKDVVDLALRRYVARPANERRNAVAAFPVGVLLAAEWRGASIRPGEGLGAIVGGVDDDGVV